MKRLRLEKKLYSGKDLVWMLFANSAALAGPEATRNILEAMAKLPAVEASEVTWCRDCGFYIQDEGACDYHCRYVEPDDYCSWAKRRKDG